jgi:hypothetical protein
VPEQAAAVGASFGHEVWKSNPESVAACESPPSSLPWIGKCYEPEFL